MTSVRSVEQARPETAVAQLGGALLANLSTVVRGKDDAVRLGVIALLSGGHLLVEDVPGVAKTLLAKSLARSIGGSFRRVQGTPDLLPSDLTGVSVYQPATSAWAFRPGPLFANVVLVDEVNRATPRTQAALLEAMEEHQVSVDGATRQLPDPFFLVATQNPFEHAGTFPLPDGELDRFAVVTELGYADAASERDVLLGRGGADLLDELEAVTDTDALRAAQKAVRAVHCEPSVADYIVAIAAATRSHPEIVIGASTRASLGVLHTAQAHAAMGARPFVTPDDVKAVAGPALAHRVSLSGGADLKAAGALVRAVLERVPVPRG
ncbi:MAG: MoxR family ATPase [Acidimicrobiia bacterium]|nr:MoxR family ATPase [Acidimicrobiia bacterium]